MRAWRCSTCLQAGVFVFVSVLASGGLVVGASAESVSLPTESSAVRDHQSQLSNDVTSLLSDSEVLGSDSLDQQRGREGLDIEEVIVQLNDVRADANVSGNVLSSPHTGSNLVEAGAFNNAAGLVFSVQNSGNHVVIQNTTLINVNLEP